MLQKIRDKAQGVFAWVILILICVPFALWGIQNYLDVGKELPVATVGDKEFFQRDVNRAYAQFSQQFAGRNIDEEVLKQQALKKLVSDEVLLQYVQELGLTVSNKETRDYIKSLQYFQVDGKFDKNQYKTLLAAQNMSSAEFTGKIKNALIMGQFQDSIINSSFATPYDIDSFFKIQNQQRAVELVTVKLPELTEKPTEQEIEAYYQQHKEDYKTPDQVAIEYVELSLDGLANKVEATDEQLQAFYEEQKDLYTTKERRKISHILFKFTEDTNADGQALEKAVKAKQRLATEDFAVLAEEVSEDKLTAKQGGDLGLFNVGDMEPAFEEAVVALQEGEVSDPVKSAFGYHLIKVTELTPGTIKPFAQVKDKVKSDYQKNVAENSFYELAETLTEVSYENPDSLAAVSDATGITIKKTGLFGRGKGEDIAAEPAIEEAAFSEEVRKGNNSEPIELGADRVVVLRQLDYQPAEVLDLQQVKSQVEASLLNDKAKKQALDSAEQIKQRVSEGGSLQRIAEEFGLELKKYDALTRNKGDLPFQLSQAIFKAAKPLGEKPTVIVVAMPTGDQVVVNLYKVIPGQISEQEKKQLDIAKTNIARVFGQSAFASLLDELENEADVTIKN